MLKRVVLAVLCAAVAAIVLLRVVPRFIGAKPEPPPTATAQAEMPPIAGSLKNFTVIALAEPAPAATFFDADGRDVSLRDFGGKLVLLNLWATWCGPCAEELPSLDRLQAELGGDRFTVLALSVDRQGAAAVQPFFKTLNIAHLGIYVDPKSAFPQALDVEGLPTTFVISPTGIVLGRLVGTAKWDSPEAKALVRYYLDRTGAGLATDG